MAKITRGVSEMNPKTTKHVLTADDLRECTLVTKNGLKMAVALDEMTYEHCWGEEESTRFSGRILTSSGAIDRIRREWNNHWGIPDGYRAYGMADTIATQKLADRMAITIKNVIFNDPATIVFWQDGTKTVVKAQDGDEFDPEKGLAMAITKKVYGNKGNYCNQLKKWLPKEEKSTLKVDPFRLFEPKEFNFTFTCDNLAKGLLNELTGAIENITFTGVKVDTSDEKPAAKKPMTFREEVAKLEPERIYPEAAGGVEGCPRDRDLGRCPFSAPEEILEERCRRCWDREIPEELMRDDI